MLGPFLIAATIAAQPTAATEMLGINVPDAFQIGHHQRNDNVEIIELVEPPETVENWSKLITSLMFFDGAKNGLDASYERWRDGLRQTCPSIRETSVRGTVDGHPAIRATLSCEQNPQTGMPEYLTAFVVQGDANLMMAQVAFRRSTTPQDTSLIERIADSLKVCDQTTLDVCSERKPTGFQAGK